jgi:septal ring factor EnvC (AmiA/AmiB activator)
MGVTGSNMAHLLNWCPPEEHKYAPIESTYHVENELLRQEIYTTQSDMKQLLKRIEHTEQTIATFTNQLAEMADSDMVIIRS